MWTFHPISPTKYAYDHKAYPDARYLLEIADLVDAKRMTYPRGYVYFIPEDGDTKKYTWPSKEFSGPRELREILENLTAAEKERLAKVWISHTGWWMGRD